MAISKEVQMGLLPEATFKIHGKDQTVRLLQDFILITPASAKDKIHKTSLDDVIGSAARPIGSTHGAGGEGGAILEIFCYPKETEGCCCSRVNTMALKRVARHIRLEVSSMEEAESWDQAIKKQISPLPRKRKLLVFVNPVSGMKQAMQTFERVVKPMFVQADVAYELIVTKHQDHAKSYVMNEMAKDAWDAIVMVGGDGILSEVIHGLYNKDPTGLSALKNVPVGIIKGGTGNGLFASMLFHNKEHFSIINGTFAIIKGKTMPMDLSQIVTKSGHQHLSFLMMSYGLISDVDIESETIRWAGISRQHIYGVLCIMRMRRYPAKFSYLPLPEEQTQEQPLRTPRNTETVVLPSLDSPLPGDQGWVTIEDKFLMILISHVSHIAEDVHSSPGKRLGDGAFHILILRKPISRFKLLKLFLHLEQGDHVSADELDVYWAKAYRLEPLTTEGIFSMDGEVIEFGPVQGTILPQAVFLCGEATPIIPSI